jgi:hypothetical protein
MIRPSSGGNVFWKHEHLWEKTMSSFETPSRFARHHAGYVAFVVVIGIAVYGCSTCAKRASFDRNAWRSGDASERGAMVYDLCAQKNRRLIGKSQLEIENLLGEPDIRNEANWIYLVDIGERFMGSTWPYNLTITFDNRGLVEAVDFTD